MYVMVRMLSYDGMLVVMWQYGYSHVTICLLSCDNMLVLVVTSLVYYNVCSLCLDSRVTTEHVWKPVVVFKLCLFVEAQNISIVHQLSRSLLMHLSNSIAVHGSINRWANFKRLCYFQHYMYSTCNLCIAELLIDVMIKTRKLITANKTQNISAVALLVLYNKSSYCGSLCDKEWIHCQKL